MKYKETLSKSLSVLEDYRCLKCFPSKGKIHSYMDKNKLYIKCVDCEKTLASIKIPDLHKENLYFKKRKDVEFLQVKGKLKKFVYDICYKIMPNSACCNLGYYVTIKNLEPVIVLFCCCGNNCSRPIEFYLQK